jgi:hypothetical protein
MVTTATTLRPPSATKGGGCPRPNLAPTPSTPQAAVTLSDASEAIADLAVKVGVAKFEKVLSEEDDSDSDSENARLGEAEFEEGREEVVEHASEAARVAAAVASEHAETGNIAFVRCFSFLSTCAHQSTHTSKAFSLAPLGPSVLRAEDTMQQRVGTTPRLCATGPLLACYATAPPPISR